MDIKIKKYCELTKQQTAQIYALQAETNKFDGTNDSVWLSNELNYDKNLPSFFCAYDGEKLVGFLTAFVPDKDEPEITAFVAPEYRKKGVFTALYNSVLAVLKAEGITNGIFCVNKSSESGKAVLKRYQTDFLRSEARMICKKALQTDFSLTFKKCDKTDIAVLGRIRAAAFNEQDNLPNYLEAIVTNPQRAAYIASLDGEPLGVFAEYFDKEADEAFLHGVGVLQEYRGKGFGKQLLIFAQQIGLEKQSKVVLDVDLDNDTALNLYTKSGFTLLYQIDYYKFNF